MFPLIPREMTICVSLAGLSCHFLSLAGAYRRFFVNDQLFH